MTQPVLPSNIPDVAQRLIDTVGLLTAMLIVDRLGGQSLRLYDKGESMARLRQVVGNDSASKVMESFGQEEFLIPLCAAMLREIRNKKIHADFDRMTNAGQSSRAVVHQLVAEYGPITERSIWRILKQLDSPIAKARRRADDRQMSLI